MKRSLVSVCIALAGFSSSASAQTRADTMKVALAAARWVQPKLSGLSRIAVAYGTNSTSMGRVEDARTLAPLLHAEPVLRSSAISCPGGPMSCSMAEYDAVVDIRIDHMDAQYAQASVRISRSTPHGNTPTYTTGWGIQFVRSDSNWVFDRLLRRKVS
jgi:hypothetical protein